MCELFDFEEIFLGLVMVETLVYDMTKALIDVFGLHLKIYM